MKYEKGKGRTEDGGKKKIMLVSPHLDDAVFSVGGLMAALAEEGYELHLVTCFTRSVLNPTGFALACQLDKGLAAEADYMELRRQEDREACRLLYAQPHWLDLPEAPHRGYESASALFQDILEEDKIQPALVERLRESADDLAPDLILSPVGIGNHVDHQQVKQAASTLQRELTETLFLHWYDEPYLSRHPEAYPDKLKKAVGIAWKILQQQAGLAEKEVTSINVAPYWEQKMSACAAYTTQIGFQFGGKEKMREVLAKKIRGTDSFTELVV